MLGNQRLNNQEPTVFENDKASAASTLSTTTTIGANLPTPPSVVTIKHQE
jgi:hypothetical protein